METTLSKLSKAADWIDRHSKARFSLLLAIPFRWMIYVVIISVAISWPPLSLVPLSATTTAIGLTFLSAGLVLRDGLYVLFGYVVLVLIYGGFALLFSGLV